MRKVALAVLASALILQVAAVASADTGGAAGFVVLRSSEPHLSRYMTASTYPVVCGEMRSATWGKGRLCKQGTEFFTSVADTAENGHCVESKKQTANGWIRISGSTACSSTFVTSDRFTLPDGYGVRIYDGSGRYFSVPRP